MPVYHPGSICDILLYIALRNLKELSLQLPEAGRRHRCSRPKCFSWIDDAQVMSSRARYFCTTIPGVKFNVGSRGHSWKVSSGYDYGAANFVESVVEASCSTAVSMSMGFALKPRLWMAVVDALVAAGS